MTRVKRSSIIATGFLLLALVGQALAEAHVYFNVKSGIYHSYSCSWASRCTRNCVDMSLSEAKKQGRACHYCGGH